jgi:outer membrane protein assembly factor BamE (lipoprotein component of BamABCDE complex)
MRRIRKYLLLILLTIAAIFAIELWRERVVYRQINIALEEGYKKLRDGMTKEQVKRILGEPQSTDKGTDREIWTWDTSDKNGALWRFLGFKERGLYIIIYFDSQGRMVDGVQPS